jgi:hypothetical protein
VARVRGSIDGDGFSESRAECIAKKILHLPTTADLSLVFLGVSEFDLWIFGYIFFGHEDDAHAPACMDAKPTSLDRRPPIISRMRHQWNCRDMLEEGG